MVKWQVRTKPRESKAMLSITLDYDVPPSRDVTIRLPENIQPGKHKLVVVVDESISKEQQPNLDAFSGSVSAFSGIDAVALQRQWRDEW
jgi:hypothetical protein